MPEHQRYLFCPPPRRLLVIACTATKRSDQGLLPASERYDGPSFRLLRRWRREHPDTAARLDIFILSAAFGFITADQLIPDYNQRLTPAAVAELRTEVTDAVRAVVTRSQYAGAYLSAGRLYQSAFGFSSARSSPDDVFAPTPVTLPPPGAGIGSQLAALKAWLLADDQLRDAA